MKKDIFSILIPTHNRAEVLEKTLTSLFKQRAPADEFVEVIVVANACTDRTLDVCEEMRSDSQFDFKVIQEPLPGLSIARNRAVKEARGSVLIFIDDDVSLEADWLGSTIATYYQTPADMVGGRVNLWWHEVSQPDWLDERHFSLLSRLDLGNERHQVNSPSAAIGANFSFRRKVFDCIGGFRTDLGRSGKKLLSAEETEFLRVALEKGFCMYYSPTAALKHWVAKSRISLKYLGGVALGNGKSAQLSRQDFGITTVFRSMLSHTSQAVWHASLAGIFWVTGQHRAKVSNWIDHCRAKGRLLGTLTRVLSVKATSTTEKRTT